MSSIIVRSYLRGKAGEFVPIEDASHACAGSVGTLGAIEFSVRGRAILTLVEWDDIGDLWRYVARMVAKLCRGAEAAETFFPDQSIVFRLGRLKGGWVEAVCEYPGVRRRGEAEGQEMLDGLARAGIEFFDTMVELGAGIGEYRVERDLLIAVRDGV